jgi:hypothetical protein
MMATSQRSKEEQARRHAAGMEAPVLVDLLALVDPLAFAERVLAETASR